MGKHNVEIETKRSIASHIKSVKLTGKLGWQYCEELRHNKTISPQNTQQLF
uniref:Uncharacterized protein n=1 Tax=Anguilla anguilla TaxID=7936 RepID=A0A0E9PQN2_ANGAN